MVQINAPTGWIEKFLAAFLRLFLRLTFKTLIGPGTSVKAQRRWVQLLALLMPGRGGIASRSVDVNGLSVEVLSPKKSDSKNVILFLHGGAFCLGSNFSHRSLCSHLAFESGMPIWVPNYRLAPEHPYPAALDDAVSIYQALLRQGYSSQHIVIAGDSAGGSLALALAIRLKKMGVSFPACIALISPVTDGLAIRQAQLLGGRGDPMISYEWLAQGLNWFNPPETSEFSPLKIDLTGLPPMLIQVGQEEILLNDSLQLEARATHFNVACHLECYLERWHVFHLQTLYLKSSKDAIRSLVQFIHQHCHYD